MSDIQDNNEELDETPMDDREDIDIDVEDDDLEDLEVVACNEDGVEIEGQSGEDGASGGKMEQQLKETREEYLRLYAEFDNYKKRAAKDKEMLSKYANEAIMLDMLPTLDHLEIALKHARDKADEDAPKDGLVEGVEMTMRELLRTLEKYGLSVIEAQGKEFDPGFHHAVSQVERDDMDDNMVVDELRKGYVYNGKVIRATMVAVSKKP